MKPVRPGVYCSTAEVPLSRARESHDELLTRFFSPREASELAGRHPRSTAGRLAAKRALCQLFEELSMDPELREVDVVLGSDRQGAPRIVELTSDAPIARERLALSISHTRTRALGLAVYQEER